MHPPQPPFHWIALRFLLLCGFGSIQASAVEMQEGDYESRPQFIVTTESATWYYDKAGGGFSRLLDREGRDWIAFSKMPLSQFPDSAAAGYRGMPNAVFIGPDKGTGHPGFDQCESEWVPPNAIRTRSRSGKWAWTWTFQKRTAHFKMEQADPGQAWWFLYEGPPAGRFAPAHQFWGTNEGGPNRDVPGIRNQRFGQWRWAYFGDTAVFRVFFTLHHQADELTDTFWYMGSSEGGAATAPNGMVVFGFGRGPGTKPLFRGPGTEFTVGFIETDRSLPEHQQIARKMKELLEKAGQPPQQPD